MRPKVGGGGGGGVAEREREGMGSLGRAVAEALGVDCSSEGMGGSWTVGRGGEEVVIRGAATWRSRGGRSWSSMSSAGGGLSRGPPGRRRGGVCEGRKKEGSQAGRRRQKRTTEATMRETPMRAMVGGAVGRCQCLAQVARLVNLFRLGSRRTWGVRISERDIALSGAGHVGGSNILPGSRILEGAWKITILVTVFRLVSCSKC